MRENERGIPVRSALRSYAFTVGARVYGEVILPLVGWKFRDLGKLKKAGFSLRDDQKGYLDATDPSVKDMSEMDLSLDALNVEETDRVSESFKDFGNHATSPSKSLSVIMRKGELMLEAIKQAQDNARLAEREARKRLIGSLIGLLSAKIQRRD